MTTTLGTAPATTRRQPALLCVLVGAAVVVGWVLYRHYLVNDVSQRIFQWGWLGERLWSIALVFALLLCVPYAVVLLVWGRGLGRAASAAFVALATGFFVWGWDRVFQNYVWHSGTTSETSIRVYDWGTLLITATLIPLAWGLARRRGRAWVFGLAVGPAVAALLRELTVRWAWLADRASGLGSHYHWQVQAAVYVTPYVLAVLACWALDARSRRTPEMQSSA